MMKIMSEGVIDIAGNLRAIQAAIKETTARRANNGAEPTLVAVSKTKSVLMIKKAYDAGQRHFGENYVKELLVKAKDADLNHLCPDIKWHYIGMLQKNKIAQLIGCPRLYMVETISSFEVADSFEKKTKEGTSYQVMIQVNTSGEDSKSGILPSECANLAFHIVENCPKLKLRGVMTIGSFGHDYSSGPNPDFECLRNCREKVCERLKIPLDNMELSMGMSADFKEAVLAGSTNVRVGSQIFGAREK
uniref:pyridoxal phosphate homeostasis protein-like n=1 Tax=Styela clava TaxID=7725 RepID=UPI001939D92A|nr:pyridoxal phosphate homeostasis protein-like [Styela clava]XP_039257051.1 pyridoxal phosphate homeostasis protein-like [Styela clava]XP_039257059.1 pyridoxal phosphate homeostasis protein-like [Styela clava]